MNLEAILLAVLAVLVPVLVGALIVLRQRQLFPFRQQLEAPMPIISDERKAEWKANRQRRQASRREWAKETAPKAAEKAREVKALLDNISDEEWQALKVEGIEAGQETAEAATAAVAAIVSREPALIVRAAIEAQQAAEEMAEFARLLREAVEE